MGGVEGGVAGDGEGVELLEGVTEGDIGRGAGSNDVGGEVGQCDDLQTLGGEGLADQVYPIVQSLAVAGLCHGQRYKVGHKKFAQIVDQTLEGPEFVAGCFFKKRLERSQSFAGGRGAKAIVKADEEVAHRQSVGHLD